MLMCPSLPPADTPFDLVSVWIPFILFTCSGDLVMLDSSEIRIITEL